MRDKAERAAAVRRAGFRDGGKRLEGGKAVPSVASGTASRGPPRWLKGPPALKNETKGGNMEIRTELKQVLKRLRLSGILFTLTERVSYARGQKLSYEEFLELVLE